METKKHYAPPISHWSELIKAIHDLVSQTQSMIPSEAARFLDKGIDATVKKYVG